MHSDGTAGTFFVTGPRTDDCQLAAGPGAGGPAGGDDSRPRLECAASGGGGLGAGAGARPRGLRRGARPRRDRQREGPQPGAVRAHDRLGVRLHVQSRRQAEGHRRDRPRDGATGRRPAHAGAADRLGLLELHPGHHRLRRADRRGRAAADHARLLAREGRRHGARRSRLGRHLRLDGLVLLHDPARHRHRGRGDRPAHGAAVRARDPRQRRARRPHPRWARRRQAQPAGRHPRGRRDGGGHVPARPRGRAADRLERPRRARHGCDRPRRAHPALPRRADSDRGRRPRRKATRAAQCRSGWHSCRTCC